MVWSILLAAMVFAVLVPIAVLCAECLAACLPHEARESPTAHVPRWQF